jgi:acyl-coenzyme A thioesterase PaaI-like protein
VGEPCRDAGSCCQDGQVERQRDVGTAGLSIQEQLFPELPCFGCGPANTKGLQLRSYAVDGVVTARFQPWPEHDNGLGYLNGGIISTILDCHSAAAVLREADQHGWAPLPGAALSYVTAGLDVRFLRPSPLGTPVELQAHVGAASEAEITCAVELACDGKVRATATAVWKRWRPR